MIERCGDCRPYLLESNFAVDFDGHTIDYLKCRLCGATYQCKPSDEEPILEGRQIILSHLGNIHFVVDLDEFTLDQLWNGVTVYDNQRWVWVEGWRVLRTFHHKPGAEELSRVREIEQMYYDTRLVELRG